uniref:Short-chain dehydrogenase/reductase SDR n=1 Tax=Caulobacter sp. (strain K31) TaxID=366602 RepID=B0T3R2_CAUSK
MAKPKSWALVTGASSGLGAEFARQLAARGYGLVLTARRKEPMQQLAEALGQEHRVDVLVEPLDLGVPGASVALQARLAARGVQIDVLINNAGFGLFGRFAAQDPDRLRQMLQVDILAMTELTHVFAQTMSHRGRGHILLVASMAAYQPTPLYAAYGAAKAYVLSLGEALHVELGPTVGVTVLSPGLMDTGFLDVAGQAPSAAMKRNMIEPTDAVKLGLDALFAGKSSIITGAVNRLAVFLNRLTSRNLQAKLILRIQQ